MADENNKRLDKHVGNKMKERRKVLNLTQAELADLLQVSPQQVQRYESGENSITMPRLLEISSFLNVKPNFFLDDALPEEELGKKIATGVIQRDALRPLEILLIEDAASDALLFRKALERVPIMTSMHVIDQSEKVIDYLSKDCMEGGRILPDIMILDINLPRMNGLALLKKLKFESSFATIPVIMLTNSIRTKDMNEAYELRANGFIQKHSDLHEFYEDVRRLLEYWSRTVILPGLAS